MSNRLICIFFLTVLINCSVIFAVPNKSKVKDWINFNRSNIPDFPVSHGLGGAYIGVSNDVLIVAGGSYYDQPLWEGGNKVYSDSIFVLTNNNSDYKWKFAGTLPHSIAHGATVETEQGLFLLGGENEERKFDSVLQLKWDQVQQQVIIKDWPSLPESVSYNSAEILNNSIYVAGGITVQDGNQITLDNFWQLNLANSSEWEELPSWPGKERFGSLLVKQTNGEYDCLYLFSGKSGMDYLTDTYRYDPRIRDERDRWKKLTNMPRAALLAPTIPIGNSQIFVFSGSDGHDIDRIEELANDYQYVKEILSYNTITDTWHKTGEVPLGIVGTDAVHFNNEILIPGGEIRPSVRTAKVYSASVKPVEQTYLTGIDYLTLTIYLGLIVLLGYYFSFFNKNTNDYFLGGQKIPFWAAGLSLMATQASAIGFMAVPAKAFATNWSYFAGVFTWIIVVPIVIYAFVPFYRRLNVVSAYEYLGKRFNNFIRRFVAGLYLLFQLIGRMGVIIYLPAIALAAVTGLDARLCIIVIGILATVYTALGGMHAVIWTDVLQSVVMFGGITFCIGYILFNIDGGLLEFINVAQQSQKFSLGSMEWSHVAPVFWIIIIGNIFNRTGLLASDQSSVQRYLTTRDEKETRKALWASVAANVPWAVLVFGLGTAIFVFYKVNPGMIDPSLSNDGIVPFFIAQNLPSGITGLLIAGIFAASMSSVDSSIHSSTTVLMRDFLQNMTASKSENQRLALSRILTVGLGLLSTITAVMMTLFDIISVWDVILEFASLFTGAMTGLFILGIFTTKANGNGATVGAISSALILLYIKSFTPIHFFLFSGIGVISSVAIGYFASFLFKSENKSLRGLTMYTLEKEVKGSLNYEG